MAERSDSSVTVSLQEIIRLEEQRAAQEAAARRAREVEERRAAQEAEAHARAREEALRRDAEARTRSEALAEGEREARRQAERDAAIAKARHEVDAAARLEELRATHEHDRQLAMLRTGTDSKRAVRTTYGLLALLAMTWAVGTWSAMRTTRRITEASAWSREESVGLRSSLESVERALQRQTERIAELQGRLDDGPRREAPPATAAPSAAPRSRTPRQSQAFRILQAPVQPAPVPRAECKQGDPVCSDLP